MYLITETNHDNVRFISEANAKGEKQYFIEGVFMQAEVKNRNGRVYPQEIMKNEIQRYSTEFVQKNRAMGELGHPEGPTVNLERVSHIIKSLRVEGKDVYGKAKILETPMGNIARNLIENEIMLGVSSRGLGSLKLNKEGVNEVQDDFHLATVDIVADPSAHDAYVQGIYESAEWICENGVWKAIDVERAQQTLKKASKANLEETKLKMFEEFISRLSR